MAGEPFDGSPRIALGAEPPLTHAVFFELPDKAAPLEEALRSEFPDRNIHVIGGDCNEHITDGLNWLRSQGTAHQGPHLGPVFALLDPNQRELRWSTVETIANWTGQAAPTDYVRRRLVELLVLFPTGPFRRTMPIVPGTPEATGADKAVADRLFGNTKWREIYDAQRTGAIDGEDSWLWYVHLYRRGLLDLGYAYTSAVEVRNTRNVVMYHLVFATANNTGRKIMTDVLGRARQILPAMVQDEKAARRAGYGPQLFGEEDADLDRYADDPDRWAYFTDEDPPAFDPSKHPRPPETQPPPEALRLFDL
jgi:three-Cys-motif partner protein